MEKWNNFILHYKEAVSLTKWSLCITYTVSSIELHIELYKDTLNAYTGEEPLELACIAQKVTSFNVRLSGVCQGAPELFEDPDNPSACSQNEGQNKCVIKDAIEIISD